MLAVDSTCPVNWQHPLNRGLAAWFLAGVQGRTGGATWFDVVSNRRGTLTNMDPKTDWVGSSRPGSSGALDFDGTNDHVIVPKAVSVRGLSSATIGLWFKPTAAPAANAGLYYESTSTASSTRFAIFHLTSTGYTQGVMRDTNTGSSFSVTESVALSANTWYHLALTVNASNDRLVLYRNGIERALNTTAKGSFTADVPAADVAIGAFNAAQFANGQIDDVRLWFRALSATEVKAYYDLSRQGYPGLLNRTGRVLGKAPAVGGFNAGFATGSNVLISGGMSA